MQYKIFMLLVRIVGFFCNISCLYANNYISFFFVLCMFSQIWQTKNIFVFNFFYSLLFIFYKFSFFFLKTEFVEEVFILFITRLPFVLILAVYPRKVIFGITKILDIIFFPVLCSVRGISALEISFLAHIVLCFQTQLKPGWFQGWGAIKTNLFGIFFLWNVILTDTEW